MTTAWVVAGILLLAGALERWRSARADRRAIAKIEAIHHAIEALREDVAREIARRP